MPQQFYISKQAADYAKRKTLRKDSLDNIAIATTIIITRLGAKAFGPKYGGISFKAFTSGIRRNSVAGTIDFLKQHSCLECDGMASHPLLPRKKRKNKGPNCTNGYRFLLPGKDADLVPYELQTIHAQKRMLELATKKPCVELRKNPTATQRALAQKLLQIDIDMDHVETVIQALKRGVAESERLRSKADLIRQKQHFVSRDSTGRLTTSVSGFPKVLRPALRIDGQALVDIDVSCCNPLLLCHRLQDSPIVSHEDLTYFRAWTETGRLYDVIAESIGTDRENVKAVILSYLCGPATFDLPRLKYQLKKASPETWADRNKVLNGFALLCEVAHWFRTTLPTVSQYLSDWKTPGEFHWAQETIKRVKKRGKKKGAHAIVGQTLQAMESKLIIETCCRNLIATAPETAFATIHDCLLVPPSLVAATKSEMLNCFLDLRLFPKLKAVPLLAQHVGTKNQCS